MPNWRSRPATATNIVADRAVHQYGLALLRQSRLSRPTQSTSHGRFEQRFIFHAQADQIVDVEESAVVDFLHGSTPIGQPIRLLFQKFMQQIEGVRLTRNSIEFFNDVFQMMPQRWTLTGSVALADEWRYRSLAPDRCAPSGLPADSLEYGPDETKCFRIPAAWHVNVGRAADSSHR